MRSHKLALAILPLCALLLSSAVHADTINFDSVVASPTFGGTTPGGSAGPTLIYPNVTFTGGVILDDFAFANESTTNPNLYATSDFATLSDASSLPGFITGTFTSPGLFGSIDLDIANGFDASSFVLGAYDASNTLLTSDVVNLDAFGSAGAVGHAHLSASNISYFTVTSNQASGNIDFAIDTVVLAPAGAVPEPGSIALLLGMGTMGAVLLVRRKKAHKSV